MIRSYSYAVTGNILPPLTVSRLSLSPEAAGFMIGMSSKEIEEKAVQNTQKKRHKLRLDFWEAALDQVRADLTIPPARAFTETYCRQSTAPLRLVQYSHLFSATQEHFPTRPGYTAAACQQRLA